MEQQRLRDNLSPPGSRAAFQGVVGETSWLRRGGHKVRLYAPSRNLQELAISSRIVGRDLVIPQFGKCDFSFLRSL